MMIPILEAVLTQGRQWVDEVSRFLEFAGGIEVLIKGEHRGGGATRTPRLFVHFTFRIKVSYVKCSFILEFTFQILISRK